MAIMGGSTMDRATSGRRMRAGCAMNPYEATVSNTLARMGAWLRGMARRYRRQLFVIAAATTTVAVSVSAGQAPPRHADAARAGDHKTLPASSK